MADGGNEVGSKPGTPDWVPRPDPTRLTTAALEREIEHLRELLSSQIQDVARDFESFALNHQGKHQDTVDTSIRHLKELTEERFASVFRMFEERDVRTEQAQRASNAALDAALSAAKELGNAQTTASSALINAQAEAASREAERTAVNTSKQIDQINLQFEAERKAADQRWQELKERIDRGEGNQAGHRAQVVETRDVRGETRLNYGAILGAVSVLLAIMAIVVAVIIGTR